MVGKTWGFDLTRFKKDFSVRISQKKIKLAWRFQYNYSKYFLSGFSWFYNFHEAAAQYSPAQKIWSPRTSPGTKDIRGAILGMDVFAVFVKGNDGLNGAWMNGDGAWMSLWMRMTAWMGHEWMGYECLYKWVNQVLGIMLGNLGAISAAWGNVRTMNQQ